jgi:hypothetical protein
MRLPSILLSTLAVIALPCVAAAQFVDTFDTLNPAWVTNRYEPAGFAPAFFDGDNRLQLTIDQTGSTANRDFTFSSQFYNTQGRERDGGITGQWTLSAEVYVSSAFNTTTGPLVRTALWGHSGTTPAGGAYLILGFTNASPTDAFNPAAADRAFRFRAFDPNFGNYVDLGVPDGFVFDAWHVLAGTATSDAFEYRIDGVLVLSEPIVGGAGLLSAMIQGYNFGEAAGYSVYWDNVSASASAIPEPSTYAVTAGMAVLALACWRRRQRAKG